MSTTKPINPNLALLTPGKTLANADSIRNAIINLNSATSTYGIAAAGTTQATATQLGSVLNQVDTVSSGTGVNLPNSSGKHDSPFQFCLVYNNGANTLQVYAFQGSSDTINGIAGSTGIGIAAGSSVLFTSTKATAWSSATLPAGTTLTDPIMKDTVVATAQTDVTASTTLVTPTGLSQTVTGGGTYTVHGYLALSASASAGTKIALAGTNSMTATSANYTVKYYNNTTLANNGNTTTFGNAAGGTTTAMTDAIIEGVVVVNAGGTLNLQFAQMTSGGTATSVLANSYLQLTRAS